jgi:hypothetical protein
MISIAVALAFQASADESGSPKPAWLSKPKAEVFRCLDPLRSGAQATVIKMRCLTAPDDRIDHCTILTNTGAPDPRYEKVALCASKSFRIRATGPDGKPVFGIPVTVPFTLAHQPDP